MDADQLARIIATLDAVVGEAKVRVKLHGIDRGFREVVRHFREMHDLLLDALAANQRLPAEYVRGPSDAAANAIEALEAFGYAARRQDAVTASIRFQSASIAQP